MPEEARRRSVASQRTTLRRPASPKSAKRRSRARAGPRPAAPAATPTSGDVVAGRYRLTNVLGSGGASVVHAAVDESTGAPVAVKLLLGSGFGSRPRVRREVAALRLLRIPGVVSLVMDGVEGETPFLVMEQVAGRPFPGGERDDWEAIAPVVLSFLETLARVHAAGVVHRDLKPSNVLVDDAGRVTLLDFGVSWGPALGRALTAAGTVIGTPEYLAPEQILGRGADPRTDLYSLGVMLYEALGGRLPHESQEFDLLVEMKRRTPPTPLRNVAPHTPRAVAEVVDRLLSIDPLDRPQSAGEVSRLLFGSAPAARQAMALPRLGSPELPERIVADALAGRSTDLWGPLGSGRTRLLGDVADRLESLRRRVRWVLPAQQAWASLAPLLGGFEDLRASTRAEAEAAITARLSALLREGTVLILDDAPLVDASSAQAIEAVRGHGVVLRAFESPVPGAVEVPALSETDLRPLFAGPDRLFHLREDGAREIWRRTGGLPGLVVAEVAAWVRAGIAEFDGAVVKVGRGALDRLRGGLSVGDELLLRPGRRARSESLEELLAWIALAWPHATIDVIARASGEPAWRLESEIEELVAQGLARQVGDGRVQPLAMPHALEVWSDERRRAAHRALADSLPEGTPLRLRHFAAAGMTGDLVRESLVIAPNLLRDGRPADAQVVLGQALDACRDQPTASSDEPQVLERFAWACVAEGSTAAVDRALYELGRAQSRPRSLRTLEALLRGAREAIAGDAKGAIRLLGRIGPLAETELELWRHAMRIRAATRLSSEHMGPVVRDAEAWAATSSHPRAAVNIAGWRAIEAYVIQDYGTMARCYDEAAAATTNVAARTASYVNAALASLRLGDLAAAKESAEHALRSARECRRALYEGYALAQLRAVEYRSGGCPEPDLELAGVVGRLGDANLEGSVCTTEAACAWRRGMDAEARALATQAAAAYAKVKDADDGRVARALAIAAGAEADDAEIESLATAAAASPGPLAGQTLGLLALARPDRAAELRARIPAARDPDRLLAPGRRWSVLSPGEAAGTESPPRARGPAAG